PFVPSFSKQVYEIFELSDPSWKEIRQDPSGKLSEPEPLLEKQDIKELRKKYKEKIANKTSKEEDKPKMSKSEISFEDFNDLDMRTGTIKEVKEVPGADNLYKLQIDVGKEELQTISGLKNHYEAEELQDKQVIVLTNLEPATILGEKSECMLLAAEGDNLSLLTTDKELDPGAEIA
ncbi:methionine--tRNA ligase subunit beta, partial [Candidatus Bipolaricaulota bacterium]|nr:methionine--tRNA ligase subunit beta [Candidatus Bipolaricaulota bacterium]